MGPGVRLWVSYPETSTEGSSRDLHTSAYICLCFFPRCQPAPHAAPALVPGLPSPSPGGSSGGPLSYDGALTLRGYANGPFPPYHLTKRPSGTLLLVTCC